MTAASTKYSCSRPGCPKEFKKAAELQRHEQSHSPRKEKIKKAHQCQYPHCDFSTDYPRSLTRHRKLHNPHAEDTAKSPKPKSRRSADQSQCGKNHFKHENPNTGEYVVGHDTFINPAARMDNSPDLGLEFVPALHAYHSFPPPAVSPFTGMPDRYGRDLAGTSVLCPRELNQFYNQRGY